MPAVGEVRTRVDAEHTGHRAGRRRIDPAQNAVRVRAAQHDHVGLAFEIEVVGVAALAAQKHRILMARHRLADGEPILVPGVRCDVHVSGLLVVAGHPGC